MTDTHDDSRTKAPAARRIEIFAGAGWRRIRSAEEKVRIVAESLTPGANVSALARAHGLTPVQILRWRRMKGAIQPAASAPPALSFAPVVADDKPAAQLREAIEIEFKGVRLRVPSQSA